MIDEESLQPLDVYRLRSDEKISLYIPRQNMDRTRDYR